MSCSLSPGFQVHLDRRHTDDRAYLDEPFKKPRALIPLSYGQTQERGQEKRFCVATPS